MSILLSFFFWLGIWQPAVQVFKLNCLEAWFWSYSIGEGLCWWFASKFSCSHFPLAFHLKICTFFLSKRSSSRHSRTNIAAIYFYPPPSSQGARGITRDVRIINSLWNLLIWMILLVANLLHLLCRRKCDDFCTVF